MPSMRLLAHHQLEGFGNCGEGMALQTTRDRRRVLWLAHESAPKNVTAVDVTNHRDRIWVTRPGEICARVERLPRVRRMALRKAVG